MKWLTFLIAGVILTFTLWPLSGSHGLTTGTITAIEDDVSEELVPIVRATVSTPREIIETVSYQSDVRYAVGDRVVVENTGGVTTIVDYYRTPALRYLFGLFLLVVLFVTNVSGLRSLAGLAASFAIIFQFVLPQIVHGSHPLTVVLIASVGILYISYYLTHGYSPKTTIALVGTFLALIATGLLTVLFGALTHLTGYGAEEASFLTAQYGSSISIYNVLLAGIIIGALGVLDDITISQASVVAELHATNSKLGVGELFRRGMRVGHDHIASLVNTLVLVYTGSSLPLLLLFTGGQTSWLSLINYEPVAEEIVRTLVGSIGLVTAVPITTFVAAYWYAHSRDAR